MTVLWSGSGMVQKFPIVGCSFLILSPEERGFSGIKISGIQRLFTQNKFCMLLLFWTTSGVYMYIYISIFLLVYYSFISVIKYIGVNNVKEAGVILPQVWEVSVLGSLAPVFLDQSGRTS